MMEQNCPNMTKTQENYNNINYNQFFQAIPPSLLTYAHVAIDGQKYLLLFINTKYIGP